MCISNSNTMNNWMNLFQQGFGMFGFNNSFGSFGQFGSMSMNGSLFNYDAMAGFAVANSVLGVVGQAVSSSKAEKQAEKQEYKNSSARLKDIVNDIQKQEKISEAKGREIDKQNGIITSANQEIETLKKQKKPEADIQNLKTAWDTEYKKDPNSPATANAKEAYDKAVSENEEIDKKIKAQEDIKKEAEAKIKTLNKEKDAADSKIKDLKAEKEKLQKEVNSYDDNHVKLKLASKDEDYNQKMKKVNLEKYNDKNDDGSFTKGDVYNAIGRFMKAVDGSPEKLKVAKELYYAHNHCGNDFDSQTIKYAQRAYDYIQKYTE